MFGKPFSKVGHQRLVGDRGVVVWQARWVSLRHGSPSGLHREDHGGQSAGQTSRRAPRPKPKSSRWAVPMSSRRQRLSASRSCRTPSVLNPLDAKSEFESVKTFCTGSSCAFGAEKRGDPRRGPRAAGGAGAPSSRTPPPPRFLRSHGGARPVDDTLAWPARRSAPGLRRLDEGSPSRRRSGAAHGGPLPTSSATCRLRPARLGRSSAFCAAPSRAAR